MENNGQQNGTSSTASSDTAFLVTSGRSQVCKPKGKSKSTWTDKLPLGPMLCCAIFVVIIGWLSVPTWRIYVHESRYEREQRNNTDSRLATAKELMIRDLWNLSSLPAPKEYVFQAMALERIAEIQKLLVGACKDGVIADEDDLLNDTKLERWTLANTMYFVFTQITTIGNNNLRLRSAIGKCFNAWIIVVGVPIMFWVLCLIAMCIDISYWQGKRLCFAAHARVFWNKKKSKPQSTEAPSFISPKTPYIYQNRLNKIHGASPQLVLLILAGYVPFFAVLVQHFAPGNLTYAEAVYYSLTTLTLVGSAESRTTNGAEIVIIFTIYTAIGISLLFWFFVALCRYCWQRRMKDAAQQTDEFPAAEPNELEPIAIAQSDNTDQRPTNYYTP